MNSSKQVKIGALLSYLSIAFNMVSGLLYTPWMIQQIGQSQYGIFTLANSVISMFMMDFGLSATSARFLSKYRAEGNQEMVNNLLGVIYKLYMIVDAIIFVALLVVYLFLDTIYVKLTPAELAQFEVVYAIAAVYSLIHFPFVTLNGVLTAYEKFIPLKTADLAHRVLQVVLTVIALLCGMGLYALVTMQAVSGLITLGIKFIVIKRKTPVKVNFAYKDFSLYKKLFGFSLWITIFVLAERLIINITPTILGIVSHSAAIAVFGIVTTIHGYTTIISTAINGMFMPRVSQFYTQENADEKMNALALKVGRFQYGLNGLIVAGFAVVGQAFIHLWMGDAYADAYWGILLVVVPGLFFNSLQIANTALSVTNRVKYAAGVILASGIVNIVLSFILSHYFGVVGACLSIFIAYIVRDVLQHIVCYKVLKLDIRRFCKVCYGRLSVPILVSIGCGLVLQYLVPFFRAKTWSALIALGIITVVIYVVLLYFVGLFKGERQRIWQYVAQKCKKNP